MAERIGGTYPWLARPGFWLVAVFAEFIAIDVLLAVPSVQQNILGLDARLYHLAVTTWLSGGDPYLTQIDRIWFAAPPPNLPALLPLVLVPADWAATAGIAVALAAAIWIVRRLKRPWYWILFPPLFMGILSGNLQNLVLALLLSRWGDIAAVALKAYAALPMAFLGRWRVLAVGALLVALSAPLLPWRQYFDDGALDSLQLQSGDRSAWRLAPVLMVPIASVLLLLVGPHRAWWSVPVIWPASQYYYSSFALPAVSLMTAAILALPSAFGPVVALFAAVLLRYISGELQLPVPRQWLASIRIRPDGKET